MKVYVGYVLCMYAYAICMGFDKNSVQEKLDSYPTKNPKWIGTYELDKNNVIELDCS